MTPNGVYFVMDAEQAEPVPEGTPNARPISLLNTMDGNEIIKQIQRLSARLSAVEGKQTA